MKNLTNVNKSEIKKKGRKISFCKWSTSCI